MSNAKSRLTFKATMAQVSVPATSANLGSGFDSLGLALDLRDRYAAQVLDDATFDVDVSGEGSADIKTDKNNLVIKAMLHGFEHMGQKPKGIALRQLNVIPHGRGLGSSAAAIVGGLALARALVLGGEQLLTDEELKNFPKVTTEVFMSNFFVSASDLSHHSKDTPLKVIGANGLLKDKPGFEVDFISNETFVDEMHSPSQYEVNMVMRGKWTLEWDGNSTRISAGDTCLIRPDLSYKMTPIGLDEASLFKVTKTNDPAGLTWRE